MTRNRKFISGRDDGPGDLESGKTTLRVIGGSLRGRKLLYGGDARTRPMKDRVREALFNLIGPRAGGKLAIDLFAGTGALGFEAISRGALRAIFVEQHFPTASVIRQNAALLGVGNLCEVVAANTFIWARQQPPNRDLPWLVFCSPPYAFYADRQVEMLSLLQVLLDLAPPDSLFVVESDRAFDDSLLPKAQAWEVREYPPAVLAMRQL